MGRIERGRFTISTNVILTSSLITRALTFGFVMLCIYIKKGDEILDADVIRIVNLVEVLGRPFGSTVQSLVFSMIGVFVLEFITGAFATWGAIRKKKMLLFVATMLSVLMLVVYTVYIVLLAIIYHKRSSLNDIIRNYINAYESGPGYISGGYYYHVVPGFYNKLGCSANRYNCLSVYKGQLVTYLQAYLGVISTCMVCHVVSIVAIEYTYRKLEFKEDFDSISQNKYYLLLTIRYGIGKNIILSIKDTWKRSKFLLATVVENIVILIVGLCLLGLGLTLCGDDYITNGALRHIFYRLQFHDYYFYDILVGLAASSVVLGVLTITTAVIGLVGFWRQSPKLITANCLLSSVLILLYFLTMVINAVFVEEINDKMTHELGKLQNGYYFSNAQSAITTAWNEMIVLLNCCGVYSHVDKLHITYGSRFCCTGAHESNMDYSGYYTSSNYKLDYFGGWYGGCYSSRTTTCSWRILYKTRVYMALYIAATVLLMILQVVSIILTNISYTKIHDQEPQGDPEQARRSICRSCTLIYRNFGIEIKRIFVRYSIRKMETIIYSIMLSIVLVLSLCLLCFAVHIRYDSIFGNNDIREELLDFISVTETRMDDAIKYFSIVLTTFSSCAIVGVVYSVLIMIPVKQRKILSILCIVIWLVLMLANIVQLGLWGKYFSEVTSSISEQLTALFVSYRFSQNSGYYYYVWNQTPYKVSLAWNTIFVKGKCCGLKENGTSFIESVWYDSTSPIDRDKAGGQDIPVQCCESETEIYPFEDRYNTGCTHIPSNYHTEGCDSVIETRLKAYSIPVFVMISIIIIAQICVVGLVFVRLRTKQSSDGKENLIELQTENDAMNVKEVEKNDETIVKEEENNDRTDVKTIENIEGIAKESAKKKRREKKSKKQSKKDIKTQPDKEQTKPIDRQKSQVSNIDQNVDIRREENNEATRDDETLDDTMGEGNNPGLPIETDSNEQGEPNENTIEGQTERVVPNND